MSNNGRYTWAFKLLTADIDQEMVYWFESTSNKMSMWRSKLTAPEPIQVSHHKICLMAA